MKISRHGRRKARIEIIPMIDTMFFLLVFFMVATLSMTVQRGLPVNLPHAATAQDELRQVVTLTVTKEGRLLFDKEPVSSTDEVKGRLSHWKSTGSDVSVVVNADRAVEHGQVVELMDAVRQAGIARIAVAVRPNERS